MDVRASPAFVVGVTKPIYSFRYFPNFSISAKYMLAIEYHSHIWQVSWQLNCSDTCQIWMRFKECSRYFYGIETFAYGEIDERSFSNPHYWRAKLIQRNGQTRAAVSKWGLHVIFYFLHTSRDEIYINRIIVKACIYIYIYNVYIYIHMLWAYSIMRTTPAYPKVYTNSSCTIKHVITFNMGISISFF